MGRVAGVLLLILASVGCGDELADGSADTDDGGTAGSDSNPTSGGNTGLTTGLSTDTADTDDTDDTWFGSSGPGWPGGTDADDSGPDPCDSQDCGAAGFCEDGEDGPVCVCDVGYASTGLDCLPCEAIEAGVLPAEVPTARATFEFMLDGQPSSELGPEFARITLHNRWSGDVVRVGNTNESPTVLMVPGNYDVRYEFREGADLPKNSAAVIQQVRVPEGDAPVTVNIETATIQGRISLAGGQTETPGLNYGRLWLVDPATDDRIALGTTQGSVYELRVTPGRYEVHYEFRESQGEAPVNGDALVETIDLAAGSTDWDIDVPVAELAGRLLIDGQPNPSGLDTGNLELRDTATGDRFPLGQTQDGAYAKTLVPGSYEIIYTAQEFGPQNPVNQGTVTGTIDVAPGSARYDIDLHTAVISGDFSVAGAVPPTDDFDDGIVVLRDAGGGQVLLGNTQAGSYSRRVLVGEYDIIYAQETASLSMPVNTQARIETLVVGKDEVRNIDIPVVEMLGTMTIGGAPAPDSPYDDGRLFLRNPQTGDSVLLGNTREGSYAARVIPGTYNVVYSNEFSDTLLPVNQGAIVASGVEITDGAVLDIDVSVATLVGDVAIQGAQPSPNEGVGQLFLRDVAADEAIFLGDTNAPAFTRPLTSGTYVMEYRGRPAESGSLGTSLPANENAAFACYEIDVD